MHNLIQISSHTNCTKRSRFQTKSCCPAASTQLRQAGNYLVQKIVNCRRKLRTASSALNWWLHKNFRPVIKREPLDCMFWPTTCPSDFCGKWKWWIHKNENANERKINESKWTAQTWHHVEETTSVAAVTMFLMIVKYLNSEARRVAASQPFYRADVPTCFVAGAGTSAAPPHGTSATSN